MAFLLDLIYLLIGVLASPWLLYAWLFQGKYREGFAERVLGRVPRREGNGPCVWFHAASLGEVNLLATLIPRFEAAYPGVTCVVTTITAAGHEQAVRKFPGHIVAYAPLDFSWAVAAAADRLRPDLLVLAELELWPNLIAAVQSRGAKVAVVNGRLSDKSYANYQLLGPLLRLLFGPLDLVAAQNVEYADRFKQLGAPAERVHVTGPIKFDGAQTDRSNPATTKLARLAGFTEDDLVFLAGSTQPDEDPLAIAAFQHLHQRHPRLRLVLVPRHPHHFDEVADMLDRSGLRWQRRSRLESDGADPAARVLLVDTVGELGAWWGTATIAYVGGSMGSRGGQNMIEPAAFGAAVAFGPHTENFRDVTALLLDAEAAVVVRDGTELTAFVERCLVEPDYAAALGTRVRDLVQCQGGACAATIELLGELCPRLIAREERRQAA